MRVSVIMLMLGAPGWLLAAPAKEPKLAMMPLEALGVEQRIARLLDYALSMEAASLGGYDVMSAQEISALLGMEKLADALGCDSISCAAQIGGALDADRMITGSVGKLGDRVTINLILFDLKTMRVSKRAAKEVQNEEGLLKHAALEALASLLKASPGAAPLASNDQAPVAEPKSPAKTKSEEQPAAIDKSVTAAAPVAKSGEVKPPADAPSPALVQPAPPGKRRRGLAWTATVLTAAAAGAGTYFAINAGNARDSAVHMNSNSDLFTYPEAQAAIDRFHASRTRSIAAFSAAGASAVLAVWAFATGRPSTVTVVPVVEQEHFDVMWRLQW